LEQDDQEIKQNYLRVSLESFNFNLESKIVLVQNELVLFTISGQPFIRVVQTQNLKNYTNTSRKEGMIAIPSGSCFSVCKFEVVFIPNAGLL
jgi:hypothetical protein